MTSIKANYQRDDNPSVNAKTESQSGKVSKEKLGIRSLLNVAFIESRALKIFLTNFLLTYNIRAGVALLLRALGLLVKYPRSLLSFQSLVGEKSLQFRVEAVRLGLFVGAFSGAYSAIVHTLWRYSGRSAKWHSGVAGWVAGLSFYFMEATWYRTLALYVATRAVQSFYNFAKSTGRWHFWGSNWQHGDSLLFILSSAQIMYAYVMRPETLPPSYYRFIVRQGPVDEVILDAVRNNCRDKAIDLPAVMKYVRDKGGESSVAAVRNMGLTSNRPISIPSRAMHPYTAWSSLHAVNAFLGTSKRIFPVYFSLALVPAIVLRFKNFWRMPISVFLSSLSSAMRSTAFLAAYCASYQGFVSLQRQIISRLHIPDHKFTYYIAAIFSGISILIERKGRRSELALYAFPRALDSLYMIMYDHKLAFRVPQGEPLLFCSSMAVLMYFFENQEDALSPLVNKLLQRFISRRNVYRLSVETQLEPDASASEITSTEGDISASDEAFNESFETRVKRGAKYPRVPSNVSLSGGFQIVP